MDEESTRQAIRIIMPSEGDMRLISEGDGSIVLQPIYYDGVCAGPHIQVVDIDETGNVVAEQTRFSMRISRSGKIRLRAGKTYEGPKDEDNSKPE